MTQNINTLAERIATLHEQTHLQTLFGGRGIRRGTLAQQLPIETVQSLNDLVEVFDILTQYVTPFEQYSDDWYPVIEYLCGKTLHDDGCGNRYVRISNDPSVMFTSHVDTFRGTLTEVVKSFDGQYITTDGRTVLGADDKAGVSAMIMMITHGVSGLYYFFDGEECGLVGSKRIASRFHSQQQFHDIQYCISIDRRNTADIRTIMGGERTCSDAFAESLRSALNEHGMKYELQESGGRTDSASFVGLIRECSNVSVGYSDEHSADETQDILFLHDLTNALIRADYSRLQYARFEH